MRPRRFARTCATLSLIILSSCGTMTASKGPTEPVVLHDFCQLAKPIYWSAKDTDQTILAAKEHNAVWKKYCQPANTP
jgi:hypothetical protein